jgi:hypothetical protein
MAAPCIALKRGSTTPFSAVAVPLSRPSRGKKTLYSAILFKVGLTGFEPATSASRTQRSSQAELQPELRKRLMHGAESAFVRLEGIFYQLTKSVHSRGKTVIILGEIASRPLASPD